MSDHGHSLKCGWPCIRQSKYYKAIFPAVISSIFCSVIALIIALQFGGKAAVATILISGLSLAFVEFDLTKRELYRYERFQMAFLAFIVFVITACVPLLLV